ncbi:MAG TPA: hypothetical protein VD833_07755 [Vicinamibacterales bacterium]|nr:hypothetical protein [Vicinamibacterales bacterium]
MRTAILVLVLLLTAVEARAQDTVSDIVGFLMTNQAVPTADFERDREAAEAARDTIARALLVNLTSVPLATSSGGFLYRLNPELGTVERATESFGAFFTERALTAGQGRASFGVTFSSSDFTRLNGLSLDDGTLVTIANRFRDEAQPFDTESLTLNVRTSTMTLLANVGITDRIEIGAAVPLVRLTLDGERVNVYRGSTFIQASAAATASGIGDTAIRGKVTLLNARNGGIAAAGEFRLPTGDEANLLGAGSTSWRLLGVGSYDRGPLGVHGNAGIVRGGVSDEITFAGALSAALSPTVTFAGEILGRHVSELRSVSLAAAPHPTIVGVDTLRLVAGSSGITQVTALAGLKWNVSGTLVLAAHVRVPVVEHGLTAAVTPTVALEYAFPR